VAALGLDVPPTLLARRFLCFFPVIQSTTFITLLGGVGAAWRAAAGDAGDRVSQRRLDDHRFSKRKEGSTRNVHKFAPMGHTQNGFALVKAA